MAKILVVDACPSDVDLYQSILKSAGHDVIAVTDNGADGIAIARYQRPDVVLVDVALPALNGFQLARRLANDPRTANIPVIIVTNKDQETDRVWGKIQGASEYLIKPINKTVLLESIESVMMCCECA